MVPTPLIANHLTQKGHEIVVLSRNSTSKPWRTVVWDGETLGKWAEEIDGATGVINLAGRSVDCRYHTKNKRIILDSRVHPTRAIHQAKTPPNFWFQMSTATIYAHTYGQANDEITGVVGGQEADMPASWKLSIDVARAWEAAAVQWSNGSTRQILMRTAMIMSPYPNSVFQILRRLTRLGLCGRAGHGHQWVSWMHYCDFLNAIEWHGKPLRSQPIPNSEFIKILRKNLRIPMGMNSPNWLLELAAFFIRTETELLLKSRKVFLNRLGQSGFNFIHPTWETASANFCHHAKINIKRSAASQAEG